MSVHIHRTSELTSCRRRVGEGAAGEILHERLHRPALATKEVVDLGEDETRNVAGACLIDGNAEESVAWSALDEIVDERPGVAK